MELLLKVADRNYLVLAFAVVGVTVWVSYLVSNKLTRGRIHGSAIAIIAGLFAAYWGGTLSGGQTGVANIPLLAGIGVMGGGMLRDFAIVATAFGVHLSELRRAGLAGVISIVAGVVVSFVVGAIVAVSFGYTDAISITTIGAGAVTYIVGPVTGDAIGADNAVIALSVRPDWSNRSLLWSGHRWWHLLSVSIIPNLPWFLAGSWGQPSGVAGGLAATDPKLVPYGAMTATFYTGFGALMAPSVLYFIVRALA